MQDGLDKSITPWDNENSVPLQLPAEMYARVSTSVRITSVNNRI